jgi:hypothetical protein
VISCANPVPPPRTMTVAMIGDSSAGRAMPSRVRPGNLPSRAWGIRRNARGAADVPAATSRLYSHRDLAWAVLCR